jgi:hypothetical protein
MKLDCNALAFVAALAASCALTIPAAQSAAGPQITQTINPTQLSVLAGTRGRRPSPPTIAGAWPTVWSLENMQLQLKRPAELEQAFGSAIDQMYLRTFAHLSSLDDGRQIGAQFGPAEQDVQTVTHWLTSHGFQVNEVYPSRMLIDFSGTAGQVRNTFATEIHNLQVNGVRHIANMSDPKIPARRWRLSFPASCRCTTSSPIRCASRARLTPMAAASSRTYALVPADLETIYNLTPLYTAGITGKGETIVTVEDTNLFTTADYTKFRSEFGLTAYTSGSLTTVHPAPVSGNANCTNPGVPAGGDDGEAALDVEYASAAAPNATVELASCKDTATFGGLIAIENIINAATHPTIISMSYGECEAENGAAQTPRSIPPSSRPLPKASPSSCRPETKMQRAAMPAPKKARTASASADGRPRLTMSRSAARISATRSPARTPPIGTRRTPRHYGSAKSYIDEIPWNDSCASVLITTFNGSTVPYGSTGFCNTANGKANYLEVAGGSGGPSGCATGAPATAGVVAEPVRVTPSRHGRPACWAILSTACAIFPMCRCSRPTACGGITMSFAGPTYRRRR